MKLCGDGPSATDFKSQAAWAGGVGKIGGKGQKTQVVGLVAAVFPFPPLSGSFQGLRCCCGLFLFSSWLACLSPRKFKPVSGGDLKGRGRRGSRCRPGADQTDLRAALCSPRILHPDSGPGGKAGPGGPGSGPCAWAGKMATPPAETAPPGHGRGRRYLRGPPVPP